VICRRVASGRTLLSVCADSDMPHPDAIYDEMRRSPPFAEAMARARAESAHGLAMQVVEIADAAGPHDNPQLVKNRCDQRRWLAGKYNVLYSEKVAITDSDGARTPDAADGVRRAPLLRDALGPRSRNRRRQAPVARAIPTQGRKRRLGPYRSCANGRQDVAGLLSASFGCKTRRRGYKSLPETNK
jgi:hypothetical protein